MTNIIDRLPALAPGTGRARRVRPGAVLAIVLAGQFMAVLDASIVNVAIPSMHAGLHASGAGLQLIVAGYTIAYAVLLVTGARLGDILGHRRMFLAGVALFTLASLGCGIAPSTGFLIGLRFAQGVGAAVMIPQVLSLLQRTYTSPGPRARAMSLYSTVIAGGAVAGQVIGGLLISADLFGSTWRPIFLVNVPVGAVLLAAGAAALPRPSGAEDSHRALDLPGLLTLTPAVLAFVLPLVLGQPLNWPAWGWALLAASAVLSGLLFAVERRVFSRGGQPILPATLLGQPGMASGIGGLFAVMTVFGGWFFAFALHLQDGLGDSALRAGLTFAPAAGAFALVSLNWRRVPQRFHHALIVTGYAMNAAGMLGLAALLRSGGTGGVPLYLLAALAGAGMAAAFSPLMTRVLMRVPVAIAADATGVIVTVNQLGIVVGVATFGTLYLNLAGRLPAGAAGAHAFLLSSAHAEALTFVALAALAIAGGLLATLHVRGTRQ
ncbi:MAG: MFS transporter [Streptosporangiaceae bacterium]|nr:MFS transporter [Streptosporangiaceae bacterium]